MCRVSALPVLVGVAICLAAVASRRLDDSAGNEDDVFAQQRGTSRTRGYDGGERRGGKTKKATPMEKPTARKPNIVLILTDDQDVELGSLNFMPRTLRLLRDEGAEFRHAYVTTPMCCPSRSSLLTGMYVHNHHVFTNNDNCSSAHWQAAHETRSFATYLSNAGYRTGYFGKYLNKYNGSYIPPGWREWGGLIMNSRYYNYSINLNGKKIKHGDDYHKDYYPDLIANDSVAFLRQSKHLARSKPVMLVVSFPAPHGPEDSAPQFSHLFFNVTTHHTPAYDYAPNPDKQWILQVTPQMQPIHREFTDLLMTKRLQTLQSVDDAVEKIYKELAALGELDNTYIVYTSDHGYHLGQFGLVKGKSFPFEFDVRVPFLVRGPNIEPGTVVDEIVLNLDVAPTLLDIAGVETPAHMDGRSILPLLHRKMAARRRHKLRWPDTFLIESSGRRETPESIAEARQRFLQQSKVTTTTPSSEGGENITSVADPWESLPVLTRPDLQLDNRVVPVVLSGSGLANKVERLALECQRPELQSPCALGQKWHCVNEGHRWRKHKCKSQQAHLSGLAHARRKCACYTPSGVMYTRLQPDERRMQRQFLKGHLNKDMKNYKPKFLRTVRSRRSVGALSLAESDGQSVDARISQLDAQLALLARRKRDTLDHVASIMDDLEDEIDGLENSQEGDDEEAGEAGMCTVSPSGGVNCSNAVYQDPKTWMLSRKSLELRIKKLRHEMEALKEIRRHLQSKRPMPSYDASIEEQDEVIRHVEESEEFHRKGARRHKQKTTSTTTTSTTEATPPSRRKHKGGRNETAGGDVSTTPGNAEDNRENLEGVEAPTADDIIHPHRKKQKHKTSTPPSTSTTESVSEDINLEAVLEAVSKKHEGLESQEDTLDSSEDDDDDDDDGGGEFDEGKFEEYDEVVEATTEGDDANHRRHQHHRGQEGEVFRPTAVPDEETEAANSSDAINALSPTPDDAAVYRESNRRPGVAARGDEEQHTCYCETDDAVARREEKERVKEARRRLKDERAKKRERKLRRKMKLEKECLSERMNCFTHDNAHWKTAPLWTAGPFCFCMNANNNTYSCVRTINVTHNFLYCEFVTGLVTFYNLRIDPFEQWNRVHSLTNEERSYLHDQLATLRACRGWQQCTVGSATQPIPAPPLLPPAHKKRKFQAQGGDLFRLAHAHQRLAEGQVNTKKEKKRKKLSKPWRRRPAWQNQWRQRERRRRFRQQQNQPQWKQYAN